MDQFVVAAVGAFILSMLLDGWLIRRRHPLVGFLIGLAPILTFGVWFLIPLLTCHSDNPVGCEWSGIGVLFVDGLTLGMLVIYSLLAFGISRAHHWEYLRSTGPIPGRRSLILSIQTIALILVFSTAGGVAAKWIHDLDRSGIFVTWRNLGTPPDLSPLPGERAVKIQSYSVGEVQILTNLDRSFKTNLEICATQKRTSSNCWYYGSDDVQPVPPINPRCWISFRVQDPPGQVLERVDISACMAAFRMQTAYVLRADGSIWAWHHDVYQDTVFSLAPALAPGVLGGMLLGIFLNGRMLRISRSKEPLNPIDGG